MIKNDYLVTCQNLQPAILEGKYKFCLVLLLVLQELILQSLKEIFLFLEEEQEEASLQDAKKKTYLHTEKVWRGAGDAEL